MPNAGVSDGVLLSTQDVTEETHATPVSESILQRNVELAPAEPTFAGQTEQSPPSIPDVKPGPSWHRDHMPIENQVNTEQMFEAKSPHTVPHRSNAPISSSSPRRRQTARRRLIQRSPRSQRQSQMASLTERFVAIEERRLENERLIIETFKEISESWSRQTQALLDLCASIRRGC